MRQLRQQPTVVQSQQVPRAPLVRGASAQQTAIQILYTLVASPLGLSYTFLLTAAGLLDLVLLFVRAATIALLLLLVLLARSALRLLVWSARFLWSTLIGLLFWTASTLLRSIQVIARFIGATLYALFHPRTTWGRTLRRLRRRRERTKRPAPRLSGIPGRPYHLRAGLGALLENSAAGLERFWRRVAARPWIVTPTFWWHLAVFEHRLTGRWLHIELPTLVRPQPIAGKRIIASGLLPSSSLGYLLAKIPLGVIALLIVIAAISGSVWFMDIAANLWSILLGNIFDPVRLVMAVGTTGLSIAVPYAAMYALNTLAYVTGRFAQRAFSPSASVRRLLEAEALVAQARTKVEQAERSRQDLIVNVSHELRTPTASIRGHIESLLIALDEPESPVASPEVLRDYLNIVQREAVRLGTLVDELLALARAETDELQLSLTPVDAADVVAEVHASLATLARRERQVTLVHEIQPALPPLIADRQRLVQVLLNLVRNAITYTPPGGLVSMMLQRADDDNLVIAVADTGSGIDSEDIDRIFERFYRTDASRARSSGGFGLGLAIVRDLVEAMGGTIHVESTLGEGSCFEVTLPIATPTMPGT